MSKPCPAAEKWLEKCKYIMSNTLLPKVLQTTPLRLYPFSGIMKQIPQNDVFCVAGGWVACLQPLPRFSTLLWLHTSMGRSPRPGECEVSTRSGRSPFSERMTGPPHAPVVRGRRGETRAPTKAVIGVFAGRGGG